MIIVRSIYFLAAFVPLHLLVAVSAARDNSPTILGFAAVATILGIVANVFVLWRFFRRTDGFYVDITSINEENGGVIFYIFSIIPIFLAASFVDMYELSIFFIVYFCVVVLAVSTRIVYANPILFMFGIRIFKASIVYNEKNINVEILSKRESLFTGKRALLARLGRHNLYIHGAY